MSARPSILPVFVPHWGCPHACVFCNQRRISGVKSHATPETVRAEVAKAAALLPPGTKPELAFYGGSFTAIPEEQQIALLSTAKQFVDEGKLSSIRLSTRPDAIDPSVLERLHAYGVETVELGAQSMCEEVLCRSNRGHTAEDVIKASRLIKEAGFILVLQMMTGLPGDSFERSIETADKLISMQPDGVRIYPTVIVRDTKLYDLWQAGEYREHTVEDAVALGAVLLPMFERAQIPVIRFGLNPTEELTAGDAVGGAYHPALGELVRSRVLRNRAEEMLQGVAAGSRVTIFVHPKQLSQMTGQNRCNVKALERMFSLTALHVKTDASLMAGTVRVEK